MQFDKVIDGKQDESMNELVFVKEESQESDHEVNLPVDLKSFLSSKSGVALNQKKMQMEDDASSCQVMNNQYSSVYEQSHSVNTFTSVIKPANIRTSNYYSKISTNSP